MSRSRSRTTTETVRNSARRGAEPPIEPEGTEWSEPRSQSVPIAASISDQEQSAAPDATEQATEPDHPTPDAATETLLSRINDATPTSDENGFARTASESESGSQTSSTSARRSRHWKTPRNAREWAAQLNSIATGVLNGTIDLDEAKIVSSISRSAAQLLTAEVQRARFLQIEPDLSLEFDESPAEPSQTPDSQEFPE
jgi:hypothetical protein